MANEKIWHPTARVQLVLRVDTLSDLESFQNPGGNTLDGSVGRVPLAANDKEEALVKNRENRDELIGNKETTAPDLFKKELSNLDRERDEIYSNAEVGSEKSLETDPDVVRFWVIPKRVSIEKNNLSDADKCTIELDYRSLPFDPRSFRFAAVRVVIGSPSAEDYASGIAKGGPQLLLPSITPPETTRWFSLTGNSRFVGFVDEWLVDFDDKGESVTLQCRDISAVLRDTEVPLSSGIDLDKPLRQGVEELIREFTSMQDVRVVFGNPVFPLRISVIVDEMEKEDGPIPRGAVESIAADLTAKERELQQVLSDSGVDAEVNGKPTKLFPTVADGLLNEDIVKKASKAGAEKKKSNKRKNSKNKSDKQVKVWDHILEVCFKLGLLPIMRGNILFLASPRDVYSGLFGRRQLIWGGNISRLRMARKAGSSDAIGKGIQIIAADPRIGRTRWARFPVLPGEPNAGILGKQGSPQPVNTRAVQANESTKPEDAFITYSISGVSSEDRLLEIAEAVFQRVARQEVEVAIETHDLSSFSEEAREGIESTDMLGIQSGDSIIVETLRTASETAAKIINPGGAYRPNNFLDISAMSLGERIDFMRRIGFPSDAAELLAGSQEFGDIQRTFRVNHASIEWKPDTGVQISIDAINFIEAKLGAFMGEEPEVNDILDLDVLDFG